MWLKCGVIGNALAAATASLLSLDGSTACTSIVLIALLAPIAWFDLTEFRIPDIYSLPAIPLGLVAAVVVNWSTLQLSLVLHVLGALAGAFVLWAVRVSYRRLRAKEGLGLGDVKLSAAAGAWVGLEGLFQVLLLASLLGLLWIGLLRATGGPSSVTRSMALPFGALLAPSIWLVWFAQASDRL